MEMTNRVNIENTEGGMLSQIVHTAVTCSEITFAMIFNKRWQNHIDFQNSRMIIDEETTFEEFNCTEFPAWRLTFIQDVDLIISSSIHHSGTGHLLKN